MSIMVQVLRKLSIDACLLVLSVHMAAQTSPLHGTTLVMSFSQHKHEVILAADSRGVQIFKPYTFVFDNMCKIGILGDRAMFAISGFYGDCFGLGSASCWWSGRDLARSLFNGLDQSNSNVAVELANEWADSMSELLVRFHRIPSHWDVPLRPDLPETSAMFASVDKHGVMHAAFVQLFRDYPVIQPTLIRPVLLKPLADPAGGKWAVTTDGSGGSTAFEFAYDTTPRANRERENWPASVANWSGSALQMEENAIRLVDLSIQFFPVRHGMPSDVGYPIDAARLTPSGVSWIQCKANCN